MAKRPEVKKVDKPKPKAADRPAEAVKPAVKAVDSPRPARAPIARHAAPGGHDARPSGKPAPEHAGRAQGKPPEGRSAATQRPRGAPKKQGVGDARPHPAVPSRQPKPKPVKIRPLSKTLQEEIDVLRGRLDTLTVSGVWTDPNPPKFTGIYGRLLRDLEAGVKLRDAFATLNQSAASIRNAQYNILGFVKDHRLLTFTTVKGK